MKNIYYIGAILILMLTFRVLENTEYFSDSYFTLKSYPAVDGAVATRPISVAIARKMILNATEKEIENRIVHTRTDQAYRKLIEGAVDFILVAQPSEKEFSYAAEHHVALEITPVGRDALIFVVDSNNPVRTLTQQEIKRIYNGKITKWEQLGGDHHPIIAYQHSPFSGSQRLMEKMVMQNQKMMRPPTFSNSGYLYDPLPVNSVGILNLISRAGAQPLAEDLPYTNKRPIGYSLFFYKNYMFTNQPLNVVAVNGVKPTPETIADKTYPFTFEIVMVTRKGGNGKAPVNRLKEWVLTAEGQEAVRDGGFIPIAAHQPHASKRTLSSFFNRSLERSKASILGL